MIETIPGPAYRIQTPRLLIRCWEPADAPLLKEAIDASLEHLRPWMPWALNEPTPLQDKIALLRRWRGEFDLGQDYVFGILNLQEDQVLGGAGLHTRVGPGALEIGYWIHAGRTGQGLATELAAALTRVAFEVERVRRVEIHCDPLNLSSAAVPRKLGYTHEATLRQRVPQEGAYRDVMLWTLLLDDYQESPAAGAVLEAYDVAGRRIL